MGELGCRGGIWVWRAPLQNPASGGPSKLPATAQSLRNPGSGRASTSALPPRNYVTSAGGFNFPGFPLRYRRGAQYLPFPQQIFLSFKEGDTPDV